MPYQALTGHNCMYIVVLGSAVLALLLGLQVGGQQHVIFVDTTIPQSITAAYTMPFIVLLNAFNTNNTIRPTCAAPGAAHVSRNTWYV